MTGKTRCEMTLHIKPLSDEYAEHHAVAHSSIASREVMPNHAIFLGAKCGNRTLRREVEVVRP
jgi:NADP-dependent 3-hydroxy acid dehydrogenase YdfG